ncbi:MAG: YtxH domain-containing protein [Sphingobacteriales bacterium]|nr:MAG: YtxH domain-containing protein [Sphingobacteriales bacterium]
MKKVLIFLAAGVTLGLLFTSKKGSKLRKQLVGKFDNMSIDTKEFMSDAASNVEAKGRQIATKTENFSESFK